MTQIKTFGVLKVSIIISTIIAGSAWIGYSINRAFWRGPEKSIFTMKQVDGHSVFVPIDDSPPQTPVNTERVELGELKTLASSGRIVLVDGRSAKDFEAGHIPGAYNLPALEMETFLPQFASQVTHDQLLAVYCGGHDCSLAQILAGSLAKKGYKRLKIYYGGYSEWFLGGNPIEKGSGENAAQK
jgi:rhodanese-related sulfurtransferase